MTSDEMAVVMQTDSFGNECDIWEDSSNMSANNIIVIEPDPYYVKEHEAPVDDTFSSSSSLSAATEAVMGYVYGW